MRSDSIWWCEKRVLKDMNPLWSEGWKSESSHVRRAIWSKVFVYLLTVVLEHCQCGLIHQGSLSVLTCVTYVFALVDYRNRSNETHCYTIILWNPAYLCSDFWMFVFGVEQVALGPLRSRSRRHAPRASFAHFAMKWNPIIDIEGNGANGVSRGARF